MGNSTLINEINAINAVENSYKLNLDNIIKNFQDYIAFQNNCEVINQNNSKV